MTQEDIYTQAEAAIEAYLHEQIDKYGSDSFIGKQYARMLHGTQQDHVQDDDVSDDYSIDDFIGDGDV